MTTIDARGLGCPKPVVMAEEELAKTAEGVVVVLVDNEASVKNLSRFALKNAIYSEVEKADGYWKVKLVKGYPCETPVQDTSRAGGMFLVIGSDVMGKDADLGAILMKGFLETLKAVKEIPDTIFLLNAGVRLSAQNEETSALLKDIEAMGTKVYSCGTCLKHYGLEGSLRAGEVGGMVVLIEGLSGGRVVWV